MNETKLDEASEKTSLFHSTRNSGASGGNVGPSRDTWRATTSRLFLHHHHRQQQVRFKSHHHLYRQHHYHHLHQKHNKQRQSGSPPKQQTSQQPQRCNADQMSTVHQQHKQILLHHHQPQSPNQQRSCQPSHTHPPHLHPRLHVHRPHSPLTPQKQKRKKQHLQLTYGSRREGSSTNVTGEEFSTVQPRLSLNRPPPVASFLGATSECPYCGAGGGHLQQNQYQHPYTQHYQHQHPLRTGVPAIARRNQAQVSRDTEGATPTASGGTSVQHCCGGAHLPPTPTGSGVVITTAPLSECKHLPAISDDHIVFLWDSNYCRSFHGIVRILQVVLSVVSLICLTTAGRREGGYLSLPLCWHFRIMVFVLVLTLMSSFVIWAAHVTGVASAFPVNWHFLDMVIYSVFAFLYLVGASLVASAFDFYEKMQVGVGHQTIQQLILSVIIGYICLFLYGTTAVIGYRQWRIQMKQYQRQKLLEEDDFEI